MLFPLLSFHEKEEGSGGSCLFRRAELRYLKLMIKERQVLFMAYVQVEENVKVFYEDWGEGDKYIFMAQTYLDYHASYLKELSKMGYHCIFIQLRGYGESSRIEMNDQASAEWVNDVLKVADALGVDKFAYTGISHGSGIGWSLMYEHPERILGYAGLVCGPKLKGGHPTSFSWRARAVKETRTPEQFKARLEANKEVMLSQLRPYHSEYWQAEIRQHVEDTYIQQLNTDEQERGMSFGKQNDPLDTEEKEIEFLKSIETPCIIFGGMQDPIVIPEAMFRTIKYVPHCKLVMYQDSNHGVHESHGEDVAHEIDYFFRERKVFG